MSGPLGGINPRNDAFAGGSLTRNAPPTSVGGSFTSIAAPGFPNPGIPAIASARNNRGSNVTIPYARVVPLHAKDALVVVDDRITLTGQKTAQEYDGLESGELAWALGRQFPIRNLAYPSYVQYSTLPSMPTAAPATGGAAGGAAGANPMGTFREPDGPNGYGPDRMQRLAYTNWIEAHFKNRVGRQVIDLKDFDMFSDEVMLLSSKLAFWSKHGLKGSDMFAVPDVVYGMQMPKSDGSLQLTDAMPQGLFVMERGPFLRSIGTDHRQVHIGAKATGAGGARTESVVLEQMVDRHLGSNVAQTALEMCLRTNGVFNWAPDGICMSKYETGPDGASDAQFDARSSQLFNVAVQGPAITKSWAGDNKLVCLPMDRVFILVVGDLTYTLADAATTTSNAAKQTKKFADELRESKDSKFKSKIAADASAIEDEFPKPSVGKDDEEAVNAFTAWIGRAGPSSSAEVIKSDAGPPPTARDGMLGMEQSMNDPSVSLDQQLAYQGRAQKLWDEYKKKIGGVGNPLDDLLGEFDKTAAEVRNGSVGVSSAKLSNLRLMRATSSYLAEYSHYNPDKSQSRLGLPINFDTVGKKKGSASYVLGGWCIGTVLDSAASRTMMGSVVRVAASSMAMNVNVNVQWWSADKLYSHYQDQERYVKPTRVIEQALKNAKITIPAGSSNDQVENLATLTQSKSEKHAGTVAQRDVYRRGPSKQFSLDLDVEAYDESKRTGADFKRGWNLDGGGGGDGNTGSSAQSGNA